MLTSLRIENFAIVKYLELDFSQGMSAFTGETGAGKSIMIDALMLALGGRGDASVIRNGEEKCDITAVFHIDSGSDPEKFLAANDLLCDHGEIILRRVLYSEGRSKSFINGQPFPLQKIKELSEMLVHIHGQHQQQTLIYHATHRQQLDNYAQHEDLLAQVLQTYKDYSKTKQELDSLKHQETQHDKIALLEFQIEELQALNVKPGEMKALHEEHQLLHHAKDYLQHTQKILWLLNGEDEPGLSGGLHKVLQLLKELPQERPAVKTALELLGSALIQCEEAYDEIQKFSEHILLDPQRLDEVEARMTNLHQAARKYHIEVSQLSSLSQQLQEELARLKNNSNQIAFLEDLLQQQTKAYEKIALSLRTSRQNFAIKLAEEITQNIQQLGMPKGRLFLEFTPLDKMHPFGLDKIEYKVCTNPGMTPDSLGKIASGGELSRISLAIEMITAQRGSTPTLLFDEVDAGIGGATAALVGQLLRKLGERLQVFCVTHQAQVACSAHHHFMVKKESNNEQTFCEVNPLNTEEKIDEIARMLGGLTITNQTRSHAQELMLQSV